MADKQGGGGGGGEWGACAILDELLCSMTKHTCIFTDSNAHFICRCEMKMKNENESICF